MEPVCHIECGEGACDGERKLQADCDACLRELWVPKDGEERDWW